MQKRRKWGLFGKRDQRRHARNRTRPLEVWFGDQRYYTLDWSRSGLCISTPRAKIQRGDLVTGYVGHMKAARLGRFAAVVARVTDNGDVGLRFLRCAPPALLRPGLAF